MSSRHSRNAALGLAMLVLLCLSPRVAAVEEYEYAVIDLGTLGGMRSEALAINNSGWVVGRAEYSADISGEWHAFLWSPNRPAEMIDLGTLSGDVNSVAWDINSSGEVVGESYVDYSTSRRAFLYSGDAINELPPYPGASFTGVRSINDASNVAGFSFPVSGRNRACLWQNGVPMDLGTLEGYLNSGASGINNLGHVVGGSYDFEQATGHAFLWQNGGMTDLGTPPGCTGSSALDINDVGQIVGLAITSGGYWRAFLYDQATMSDLGTLGGAESEAYSINNEGWVVGWAHTSAGYTRAVMYRDGAIIDLNDLISPLSGWSLGVAAGINDVGQIVAFGHKGSDHQRALLVNRFNVPRPGKNLLWPGLYEWQDIGDHDGNQDQDVLLKSEGDNAGNKIELWGLNFEGREADPKFAVRYVPASGTPRWIGACNYPSGHNACRTAGPDTNGDSVRDVFALIKWENWVDENSQDQHGDVYVFDPSTETLTRTPLGDSPFPPFTWDPAPVSYGPLDPPTPSPKMVFFEYFKVQLESRQGDEWSYVVELGSAKGTTVHAGDKWTISPGTVSGAHVDAEAILPESGAWEVAEWGPSFVAFRATQDAIITADSLSGFHVTSSGCQGEIRWCSFGEMIGNFGGVAGPVAAFGDVDSNGVVDGLDLTAVITAWQTTPGDPLWNPFADLDCNGIVDGLDLTAVISNWTTAAAAAPPAASEPTSAEAVERGAETLKSGRGAHGRGNVRRGAGNVQRD